MNEEIKGPSPEEMMQSNQEAHKQESVLSDIIDGVSGDVSPEFKSFFENLSQIIIICKDKIGPMLEIAPKLLPEFKAHPLAAAKELVVIVEKVLK